MAAYHATPKKKRMTLLSQQDFCDSLPKCKALQQLKLKPKMYLLVPKYSLQGLQNHFMKAKIKLRTPLGLQNKAFLRSLLFI